MPEKLLLVVGKHVAKWGEIIINDFESDFKTTLQFVNMMCYFQPLNEKKDWNIGWYFQNIGFMHTV